MKFIILFCFVYISFLFISCDNEDKNVNKETEKIDIEKPFYMINVPDTISIGIPIVFEIKLYYPTNSKEDYFSHLILSDSLEITLDNILEEKTRLSVMNSSYDITELQTNHWEVNCVFNKKGKSIIKGGIFVHTMDFGNVKNDSIEVFQKKHIIPIKKEIYVK